MELKQFAGENKSDLSMIEVARAILENKGAAMAFADIVNEIQQYLDKTDQEIREHLPQFYTDLNDDGDFISLGENVWGLRTWYPYDSVDEEVNHPEDAEDVKTPKIKRVNAFLDDDEDDDDEDVIDYDDDSSDVLDDDSDDDEHIPDLSKFSSSDLDFDADDNTLPDDGLDDGIEGDLSEFSDADDTDDEDDNN
ncbi:MAG: DNA-directed RNA polymerase subunit delta [Bombilactobacillus mellis]|uniref:DNA-directed RNA polymerase subunit delta n=1 Tax=Bombilactobacillus mellis TaxID=1218508 RepID=UPI00157FE269|nr:DNA-directed RNA polymerase subunit delta [Bombilactobacillus mellis]MCT6806655.1 DNA-directed RNA polymerase subunit delta [Bombilactobacillus sp.]MCT6841055.1 DNA-directed RNA polymerase subunit delta [Bombilactobacillus mellis]MCT6856805.1 DNA-directed RNA polymerase subunit delta [Bombilactobacillus mellis]MCT6872777.1 DNA-directed RNA polymerase subunit delta [Bombilactobacillus mellis]MCX0279204.1 DNA-directed RNA polymerase subunit delta [Bombilactobacillus mellis]